MTALRAGTGPNWLRDGEESAPQSAGFARPEILRIHDWFDEPFVYRALETSLAASPVIETTPVAGARGAQVSDRWIANYKRSVLALRAVNTQRERVVPDRVEPLIRKWFGASAPYVADEWHTAHGDPNWSNVTAPQLTLLDWELWGRAPRAFDLASLAAFACGEPELQQRLEAAFADELATPSGQVAYLLALAEVLNLIEQGWLSPAYQAPAMRSAQAVIYRATGRGLYDPRRILVRPAVSATAS